MLLRGLHGFVTEQLAYFLQRYPSFQAFNRRCVTQLMRMLPRKPSLTEQGPQIVLPIVTAIVGRDDPCVRLHATVAMLGTGRACGMGFLSHRYTTKILQHRRGVEIAVDTAWLYEFRERMRRFEGQRKPRSGEVAASIKIRVASGCFHREHPRVCVRAYRRKPEEDRNH